MTSASLPRPVERTAIASLIGVFLCGVMAGAIAMSFWFHPALHPSLTKGTGINTAVHEWKKTLSLTDDQTRQLSSILEDFAHYYDNILADGNTRILQILNPEQKKKYLKMIAEHPRL